MSYYQATPGIRYAYDSNNMLQYLGLSEPGAGENQNKWKILKFEYNSDNLVEKTLHPDGRPLYEHKWVSRENLEYS
jgi:hypothetical protein